MANSALFSATSGAGPYLSLTISQATPYFAAQLYMTAAQRTALGNHGSGDIVETPDLAYFLQNPNGSSTPWGSNGSISSSGPAFTADTWHLLEVFYNSVTGIAQVAIDSTPLTDTNVSTESPVTQLVVGLRGGFHAVGVGLYIGKVWVGTTVALSDVLLEDWSAGNLSNWTSSTVSAGSTITVGSAPAAPPTLTPTLTAGGGGGPGTPGAGRVLIAFDDTPLEPSPTWTRIDSTANLVAGYDIHRGKQTLLDRTDTGTATVYLNDTAGLFDPANVSSPYFGKLDGKQIMLQIWNPVTLDWWPQFTGHINDYGYDLNPTQVVSNIQIDCVDIFDYLGGYEVAPGLDGTTPPSGSEGTVFYEDTDGTVDDRIKEALTDAGIDSTRWVVFTGNVKVQETKYDPGDAILNVLRDAADAEFPGIANIYVDKQGRFVFHGRRSRFDPDSVAASATPGAWDFTRWKAGDYAAILLDSARAQVRVLSYSRSRSDLINAAISYPRHDPNEENKIPGQVYVDPTSITAYGKHSWSAQDLIISEGSTTGNDKWQETFLFGKFMVLNQKDPANRISQLTIKSVTPHDTRATATWGILVGADISDIVNIKVGYPGGTGINADDFYIEGVTMRVRPLQAIESGGFDNVELDLDVSPAEWSMDTHNVFGNSGARGPTSTASTGANAGTISIT